MTFASSDDKIVAAYVRVSSEEQVDNTSLDSQVQTCQAAALLKSDPLPVAYRDEGFTGTTADRPAWQRLMRDCRAGKVRRIYVLNWSRLARDAAVGTQILQDLKALGVELTVVEQDFDGNTLMGDFLQKLMLLLAELDRNARRAHGEGSARDGGPRPLAVRWGIPVRLPSNGWQNEQAGHRRGRGRHPPPDHFLDRRGGPHDG